MEAVTILLRAIFFTPLSEAEYNGDFQDEQSYSSQDTMKVASYKEYTRLISKTNGPVKFPRFLDHYRNIQRNTKWPEHFRVYIHLSGTRRLPVLKPADL